jgi:hypothetical protein
VKGGPLRAGARAADNGGVSRRVRLVLVFLLVVAVGAFILVVKFFEFVGSQN